MERSMPQTSFASVKIFSPPFDRETLVEHLRRRIGALVAVLPVTGVVLFGSYVRGRHTVASDVDLLVIYAGPKRDDAYALARRTLDLPRLEPHLYTEEEYHFQKDMLDRMAADGVPLLP